MLGAAYLNSPPPIAYGQEAPNGVIVEMLSKIDKTEIYNTTSMLQNFITRKYGTPGNAEAQKYLYNKISNISQLSVEYQGNYSNIIATLPGVDTTSDATYIVGAHYDSTSTDPNNAPGAMDDAIGVAIVMELARIMSQYQFSHTLKFALWNWEEDGPWKGSTEYVRYANNTNMNIPLYINLDPFCFDPLGKLILDINTNQQSKWASDMITEYNALYGINFTLHYNIDVGNGDFKAFWAGGYTALNFNSGPRPPGYHTPTDTIDKISFAHAAKLTQLSISLLAGLAVEVQPEVPPTDNPPADNKAPFTTDNYDGLWHTSDFTITLSATDDFGVRETYYRLNNGPINNVGTDGMPRIETESRGNTLEYWSIDIDGKEESPHNLLTQIKLDKTSPTGLIQPFNGSTYTNSTKVYLKLSANDTVSGVSQKRLSNDNNSWSDWEPYTNSKSWNLQPGDGAKDVFVQYKDRAGLTSTYNTSITVDTTKPIVNVVQNQIVSQGTNVEFSASSIDNNDIACYSWDFGDGSNGTGATPTHTYSSPGPYNAQVTVQDVAGNIATENMTIQVQSTREAPPMLVVPLIIIIVAVTGLPVILRRRKRASWRHTRP